jgi:hypothetical protein
MYFITSRALHMCHFIYSYCGRKHKTVLYVLRAGSRVGTLRARKHEFKYNTGVYSNAVHYTFHTRMF